MQLDITIELSDQSQPTGLPSPALASSVFFPQHHGLYPANELPLPPLFFIAPDMDIGEPVSVEREPYEAWRKVWKGVAPEQGENWRRPLQKAELQIVKPRLYVARI
jgi:hypothetical protein